MGKRHSVGLTLSLVLAAAAVVGVASRQIPRRIGLNQVKNFRGQLVTACGWVTTHDCNHEEGVTTLDLDKPYWSNGVGVLVSKHARRTFPGRLEDRYALARICATGIVERRKRRDFIRVEGPDQVVIDKAPPPVTFPPDAARPCDAGIALPELVREIKPAYTEAAMRALLQGKVYLEVIVSADGRVAGSRVLHGFDEDHGLHASAISAVQKWRFKPGTASGKPITVIVTVELLFTLK